VTGFRLNPDAPPTIVAASEAIDGRHLLLRSAVEVQAAAETHWSIPADVARLVATV
jgi:CRISPR-associated endonuclease/helicase Cas3